MFVVGHVHVTFENAKISGQNGAIGPLVRLGDIFNQVRRSRRARGTAMHSVPAGHEHFLVAPKP